MIISKTPLRISFIGGGSDLRAYYKQRVGSVLTATINKYIYININRRFVDLIRVGYSQIEEVENVSDIKHNLVREAIRMVGGISKGTDIVYMSDMLPAHEGFGLGASSSLLVGTLNALYAMQNKFASAKTLAEQACHIEVDVLKNPIGKQDQYAAAFGGINYITFNPDESVFVRPVILGNALKAKLDKKLIAFYTGINSYSSTILKEQNERTESNLSYLDEMVKLSETLLGELQNGNIDSFGRILHEGWLLKRKLASCISNSAIDTYYDKALKAGAVGGKILGSGGGGFLLLYCDEDKQDSVRAALSTLKELHFSFCQEGSKIIYVED